MAITLCHLKSFVSIAPTNPPDVESYFYHLQNKWWNMAAFLGYSKDDLDAVITEPDNSVQRQIAKFLAIFKMPDCGACTITILHKAGGKGGITSQSKREHFGLQWGEYSLYQASLMIVNLVLLTLCCGFLSWNEGDDLWCIYAYA